VRHYVAGRPNELAIASCPFSGRAEFQDS
jgi:hypothetical protein